MNEWDQKWLNNSQTRKRIKDIYSTWMRANGIAILIFSRFDEKCHKNDWQTTKKWPRNEQEMTKKWLRMSQKILFITVNN